MVEAIQSERKYAVKASPKNILVFRALFIGDMLCAIPSFRALRKAFPDSRMTLMGLPWAREMKERFPFYFDNFIEFPGFPGLPEIPPNLEALPRFIELIQKMKFDLTIQMQGDGTIINPLLALFQSGRTAGFFRKGDFCPDPELFLPYEGLGHEIQRLLRLMAHLGIATGSEELEFPLYKRDFDSLASVLKGRQKNTPYLCLHPGARFPSRRWPESGFAEVGDYFSRKGYDIYLTGTLEEKPITSAIARKMKGKAIDLAGETDLGSLGALLAYARLLISNDTGVAHMASALKVPSVIISCGSDPLRWATLTHFQKTIYHIPTCRPCMHPECPRNHECALGVKPSQVIPLGLNLIERKEYGNR